MAAQGSEARKSIFRTALILSGLTMFEFFIAFTKHLYPSMFGISEAAAHTIVVVTFIILTLFKAFYIVAEFMHLGHEVKRLAWSILIPFLFIVWLIIGLTLEGDYWGKLSSSEQVNVPEMIDLRA
ncbi:MAG: cytochrome C oxidase subunit IV family protein [Bacteroidia bacterium]|jgi:cytochrome c oxidase subunit IV|nr:cytochrome C oxidase subunit IV family protein [Bacteroidia bacterium]